VVFTARRVRIVVALTIAARIAVLLGRTIDDLDDIVTEDPMTSRSRNTS